MTRPNCLYCAQPIAKRSRMTHFVLPRPGREQESLGDIVRTVPVPGGRVAGRDELSQHTNRTVLSVRYSKVPGEPGIYAFTDWDGVSYVDPYFCVNTCALAFAHVAARSGVRVVKGGTRT